MPIKSRLPGAARAQSSSIRAGTDIVATGWEDAPTEFTQRNVFMLVVGDTGTGRTSLALTAPGPIGLAHCGEKVEGIVQKFSQIKPVKMFNFALAAVGDVDQISAQANAVWSPLVANWLGAIDGWARTVIMDTDTEGWELLRLARFGTLNPKGRTDSLYGPVNAEWKTLWKRHKREGRCNVIACAQTKDEWIEKFRGDKKESARTGRTIRVGMREMNIMADVVVRTGRNIDGGFTATIEKGWMNAHAEGLTLENEDISFAKIMSLITNTDESYWNE